MFGYRWKDSDDTGGPAFDWVDITGVGTPITGLTGDDQNSGPFPIGFQFPFYGTLFNEVHVSTNGWVSFTSAATSYSNQSLPSSGAPENLLAPFWDDLHFRSAEHAYYYNDGSRFIVQFDHVDTYATGSDLTFEVILYPSGRIVYQYLSMSGTLTSSTIGIQNAAKSDGLTVAFNSAYVHDNLAVAFTALPQWLTASPTSGRITAGGSVPINAHINASGLEGGTYPGQINIQNNDPNNPVVTVDVTLVVTGAPDAVVTPTSLAFGDAFLGVPNSLTLTVFNDGTDVLHVSGISSPSMEVAASPSSFDLDPHAAQQVTVTWSPAVLGPFMTTLSVASDDLGEPVIDIPITGNAIPAPVVVYSPQSYSETLFSGGMVTRNLHVSNTGGSDLELTVGADLGNGAGIVFSDPSTLGSGGPDAFGYKWRDSDEPGGPAFSWVDISGVGTPIPFAGTEPDDTNYGPIDIGFDFNFYGQAFNSIRACTNGWISFTSTSTSLSNTNLPSGGTSAPNNLLAAFWDDLRFYAANGAQAFTYNDGSRFIVQYQNVSKYGQASTSLMNFEFILYPSGKIVFQYLDMSGSLNSATIGIQNETRDDGLEANYNTDYVHGNMAVQFSRTPDWLAVTPSSATIPPGTSADFDVTFDATDRVGGVLNGNVVLGTNIPGQETIPIPATLTVIGAPQATIAPATYDFGTVYAGFAQLTNFQVINNGTDVLNVTDVVSTDPELQVFEQPGPTAGYALAPGASRLYGMTWLPSTPGTLTAQVLVHSDDPDNPTIAMDVTGVAIAAPIAGWSPSSFTEMLTSGDIVTRQLHLTNSGGSDLEFSSSLRALGGAPVTIYPGLELKKDEVDPRPGVLGAGGPDMFGYAWKDSDEQGGPSFQWTDISGIGTPVTWVGTSLDDTISDPIDMGMTFSFYGNDFDQVHINTNGWVSFTSTTASGSAAYSNQPLPNSGTSVPENLLAVFWDDLHRRDAANNAYTYNDGTRFIIQFDHFGRISPSTGVDLTFQVILYPNGRIVYQYLTMQGASLDSATVGIQNDARDDGLTVVYNADYVHENMAVEIRPPVDYLTVTPSSGVVPAGGSVDLDVRIDSTGMIGGDYDASIDLATNDPSHAAISVPVHLHVTGVPGYRGPAGIADLPHDVPRVRVDAAPFHQERRHGRAAHLGGIHHRRLHRDGPHRADRPSGRRHDGPRGDIHADGGRPKSRQHRRPERRPGRRHLHGASGRAGAGSAGSQHGPDLHRHGPAPGRDPDQDPDAQQQRRERPGMVRPGRTSSRCSRS